MELSLESSVQYLPHVGPVMAKRLTKLGVTTISDLLYYPPFRYDDYSLVSPIANIQPGETVTVRGTVEWLKSFITKHGKKIQQGMVSDESGSLMVVWFNQPYLTTVIQKEMMVSLAGEVSWFGRQIVLSSPDYEILGDATMGNTSIHTGRLVPVYSETEGVSSKWLRGRIAYALEKYSSLLTDPLPPDLLRTHGFPDIQRTLAALHFPETLATAALARRRLAHDELLRTHLQAQVARRTWENTQESYSIPVSKKNVTAFISTLPFTLTGDQEKVMQEVLEDLGKPYPANRLIEGDVGAGKTVVAAIAMYAVFKNGLRSVLMAPTEILATQHFETITRLLTPHGIRVGIVTGSQKTRGSEKNLTAQDALFSPTGEPLHVLVGTHALLSQSVDLKNTGLVVIDEQQRFGVRQRLLIRKKGESRRTPHLLTMTATPIPRTIALTLYGNLDLSVIHELPIGRKRVKTWVIPKEKRNGAYEWITREIKGKGGQVFILCPLIDESDTLTSVKAATREFTRLKDGELRELRLGLLHGRMKPEKKRALLDSFRKKELDVLVTTPVVEVGIDIPNATIMMIEAADRFGLGQLHQLRGRVGRGDKDSYCLLFTESEDEPIVARLKALETMYNGPELAELDLKLRGPGEVFGTRQHGLPVFRFADFSDTSLLAATQSEAKTILRDDPELTRHSLLRQMIEKATIGETTQD